MSDLHTLATRLRALRDEWGPGVARTAFDERASALSAEEHAQLAALVFGEDPATLTALLARNIGGRAKSPERWQRDVVLAAEIALNLGWSELKQRGLDAALLRDELRRGLVELLQERRRLLASADRVRAGFLLGDLGDPRYPISIDEWRGELDRARTGDQRGYFCRVEPGRYLIGSDDGDPDADEIEKPQHAVSFDAPFLIGRYPITNQQWATWVAAGGQPLLSAENSYLNRPNQPVVGVDWRACNSFCSWLSDQLGVTLRLPTESQWEAAARGTDMRRYPWGNAWDSQRAATLEDLEDRSWPWTVPVGCYAAGAGSCGALDLAGNVWEWTADAWHSYPGASDPFVDSGWRMLRGGSFPQRKEAARCAARFWNRPNHILNLEGLRVVVEL